MDEINSRENDNINDLKILLANKATTMIHGTKAAKMQSRLLKKPSLEISLVLPYPH